MVVLNARASRALRRVAARPEMAATGHPEDMANLIRRTLIRTNAPILSSCKRMEPTLLMVLQHVPTAMNRDSQDTPEVRV